MSSAIEGLWPPPFACVRSAGSLSLAGPVRLELASGADGWAEALRGRLAWILVPNDEVGASETVIRVDHDSSLAQEEFRLAIAADGLTVAAGSVLGAGHAAVVLRQLVGVDAHRSVPIDRAGWSVPIVRIHDWPMHSWRGFMLDVARHFVPKDELLRVIDRMAMHRLNRLHLHLTDDQGWRVESRAFPEIGRVASWRPATGIGMIPFDGSEQELDGTPHGGLYSLNDLREITAYARSQGITVVPEIDLPAHASAVLAAVPQLRVPGIDVPEVTCRFTPSGRVVSPLDASRAALATLLAELADAIDSPYVHIGGDEASLADWEASAEVQEAIAAKGLGDVAAMRVDLTRFLIEVLHGLGRTPVVWEEAFVAGGLSPDTVVMAWRSEAKGLAAMEAGHDVVMTPLDGNYLDYSEPGLDEPLAIGGGQSIERVAAYTAARGDGPGRLLGTQAALWTELAPDARTRAYRMFPRLCVASANSWTGQATDWPAVRPALEHHLERLSAAGVEYRPLDGPHPWQRGGTGARRSTSPLTVDMVVNLLGATLDDSGMPDLDDLLN
ncbi:MAG TPA: family 20 glycosylhydrolase [Dermatophilaceae bacterium]|nr:family 20 glycosylhydrolase [Dermatophilaceae bacterium]